MIVNQRIRNAFFDQIVKVPNAHVEQGRTSMFDPDDFKDSEGRRQTVVCINTFDSVLDTLEPKTMSACCEYAVQVTLTVGIFAPLKNTTEQDIEAVERELWPLIARVTPPANVKIALQSASTRPDQLDSVCPVAVRTIAFDVSYRFDPMNPDVAL